jgi:hypothetical protein
LIAVGSIALRGVEDWVAVIKSYQGLSSPIATLKRDGFDGKDCGYISGLLMSGGESLWP